MSSVKDHLDYTDLLTDRIKERFDILSKSKDAKEIFKQLNAKCSDSGATLLDHPFFILRIVSLYRLMVASGKLAESAKFVRIVQDYFNSKTYHQLSLHAIPNSTFDAAELVFSLEGLLLLKNDPKYVNRELVDRVFQVIEEAQKHSVYWRPLKPFVSTDQGTVLLPLSVEIANSLLRICKLAERTDESHYYFSQYKDLFTTYFAWLQKRTVKQSIANDSFVGWHSEHDEAEGSIHTWQTAQVLKYLMNFYTMQHEHIARTSLQMSGFTVKHHHVQHPVEDWNKFVDDREPILSVNGMDIFQLIGKEYVIPRIKATSPINVEHHSMLLYGPAGTQNTTVAETIAEILGWQYISLSPSDFIAEGGALVEARAKAIFQVLEEQRDTVIMFDEIDRLILDRDSKAYLNQSDIFQFMTPSMLVKIKALRQKAQSIFLIGTNYAERIDQAIKRQGRIDVKHLVCPPNLERRAKMIKGFIEDKVNPLAKLNVRTKKDAIIMKIAQGTPLMNYDEIKLAVRRINNQMKRDMSNIDELLMTQEQPTVWLTNYDSRFNFELSDRFIYAQEPFKEFYWLLYLRLENEIYTLRALDTKEITVIKKVLTRDDVNSPMDKTNIQAAFNRYGIEATTCAKVAEHLAEVLV
jgi:hypothetical protein